MTYVIGLDLGTTTGKAVALSTQGEVLATADCTYPLHAPHPGWAEQDVQDVWDGAQRVLRQICQTLNDAPAGLSISGAMHSLLPVRRDGTALGRAMTWADNRAAPYVADLRAATDPMALYNRTGCPLVSTYHHARLRWCVENNDGDKDVELYTGIKGWILHRLIGKWVMDLDIASTTGLLNIRTREWDTEALKLCDISADKMLPLAKAYDVVGEITKQAAEATGLPEGMPVITGSSDGALASLGSGVVKPGQVVVTVGTSGAVRKVVENPLIDPHERTWCYIYRAERFLAGGAINNGGMTQQWVREHFYNDIPDDNDAYAQLEDEARQVEPGAQGVLMLPYLTGERSPHWQPQLNATITGLRREHERGVIARAALESVAFCLADVWEALDPSAAALPVRLTGGVTRSALWCQIIADTLNVPLLPIEVADASAIGAAQLAHIGLGHLTLDDIANMTLETGDPIEPDSARNETLREHHAAFQALYHRLHQP